MTLRERPKGVAVTHWLIKVFEQDPVAERGREYHIRRKVTFMKLEGGTWYPHVRHLGMWFQVHQNQENGNRYIIVAEGIANGKA